MSTERMSRRPSGLGVATWEVSVTSVRGRRWGVECEEASSAGSMGVVLEKYDCSAFHTCARLWRLRLFDRNSKGSEEVLSGLSPNTRGNCRGCD